MALGLALLVGCGATRSSDSARTATEQMLMSSAIDRAVNEINLQPLAGKEIYLDTDRLTGFADQHYLIGTLRQAMLSNGVQLKPDRASAKYIVEARAGVLGTNSSSVMIGIPATNLPNLGTPGVPSAIPEIPFAKTTNQAGIAKIALFAYNQQTGKPIWQSGTFPVVADAKNTWFFGAGPYQRGSIYGDARGTNERGLLSFRGESIAASAKSAIPVTAEAVFDEPAEQVASKPDIKDDKPAANAPLAITPPPNASAGAKPATPPAAPPPVAPAPPPPPSVVLDQPAPVATTGLFNALGDSQGLFGTLKK
ncbi:MAG TPA: DUF6655 family protein [Pirellulales bacterium]|nr:DUF6655 family protein [Pirellulales bacterium]